jgi:hypothetical protein
MSSDRRVDARIPVEIYATQFIDDRPFRSVVSDLSLTGLHASRLVQPMWRSSKVIQIELPLPGFEESLWAKAEVVYDALDPFFHGTGIRFLAMASYHERLLGEWVELARQEVLTRMIGKIRSQSAAASQIA